MQYFVEAFTDMKSFGFGDVLFAGSTAFVCMGYKRVRHFCEHQPPTITAQFFQVSADFCRFALCNLGVPGRVGRTCEVPKKNFISMAIYFYAYTETDIQTDMHTYTTSLCTHICIRSIQPSMHACMRACIHTYMHTYIRTYIHTYTHTYTHVSI